MKAVVSPYSPIYQKDVKRVVTDGFAEFGFTFNPQYDSDLDDPGIYEANGGMMFVLKIDGKAVGAVAVINKGKTTGELKRMYLDKEFRGKGYGSLLFDTALAFCKEKGFTKLEFETNKKFKQAHAFYQKKGCEIVGEDARSYYMEKLL